MADPQALIIDDNQNNAEVLESLLAESNIASHTLLRSGGVEAVLVSDQYDIVFVDLEMPEKTGYDVLDILQAQASYTNVPVVAYSVHISEAKEARRRGFHSFLSKPLKHNLFSDQVQRILHGDKVWDI